MDTSNEKNMNKYTHNYIWLLLFLAIIYLIYFFSKNVYYTLTGFLVIPISFILYRIYMVRLQNSEEIRKLEQVFPDFIELVSSNLRAGMTIDKALILSSRKEFSPLDKHIMYLGKDILTGKEIDLALSDMAKRTKSERIQKTMDLIVSGIRSGGNIAILLEETANNLRERQFVEKRAASNVLMYVLLISFGVNVGAPILFSLSTVLVQILTTIISDLPSSTSTVTNLPFSLGAISITPEFVTIFSLVFLFVSGILSSLMLGLVTKGDEKQGLRFIPFFIGISYAIFFISRIFLGNAFADLLG